MFIYVMGYPVSQRQIENATNDSRIIYCHSATQGYSTKSSCSDLFFHFLSNITVFKRNECGIFFCRCFFYVRLVYTYSWDLNEMIPDTASLSQLNCSSKPLCSPPVCGVCTSFLYESLAHWAPAHPLNEVETQNKWWWKPGDTWLHFMTCWYIFTSSCLIG